MSGQVRTSHWVAGATLVVASASGWAAESAEVVEGGRIEVTGQRSSDISDRRNETAGKIIVGREEIERFGESNVGSLLRRLPGISYTGKAGRPGEIKMRGMGGGYTQILIDGEKMPPRAGRAVSVDMLPAEMIERIEIVRSATAENSAQAIAGTINIVLREDVRRSFTSVRAGINGEAGRASPQVSFQKNGKFDGMSYLLAGAVNRRALFDDGREMVRRLDSSGQVLEDQVESSIRQGYSKEINLSPRFSWRWTNGHQLTLTPFVMASRTRTSGQVGLDQQVGVPVFQTADQQNERSNQMWRLMGNWSHRAEDGRRLTARVSGYNGLSRASRYRTERDGAGRLSRWVDDDGSTRYQGASLGGKWSTPWQDAHTLSVGGDASLGMRREQRTILENGVPSRREDGTALHSREQQMALFIQDEWETSPTLSLNAGLRWEQVKLQADDHGNTRRNQSQVLSPSLHTLWRFDEKHGQQLRFSLARTFKTPNLSDLSSRLVRSHDNNPTSPDSLGNPALKPELSWGYDVAYEHYLSENGLLSANLFMRDIRDLIRRRTTQRDGRWVRQPINVSKARSYGMELELKHHLNVLWPQLPAVEVKGNYSRLFSKVYDLPGPDNRLDEQPRQLANLGGDYRFKASPFSVGMNVSWTGGYDVQTSEQQRAHIAAKQSTDIYMVWHADRDTKLRATVGNIEQRDHRRDAMTASPDGGLTQSAVIDPTRMSWSLTLEAKL
nr:TonB-dependent receptor [Chitinivorax tropicus]